MEFSILVKGRLSYLHQPFLKVRKENKKKIKKNFKDIKKLNKMARYCQTKNKEKPKEERAQ